MNSLKIEDVQVGDVLSNNIQPKNVICIIAIYNNTVSGVYCWKGIFESYTGFGSIDDKHISMWTKMELNDRF